MATQGPARKLRKPKKKKKKAALKRMLRRGSAKGLPSGLRVRKGHAPTSPGRRASRSQRVGSKSFPSGVRTRMGVAPAPSDRGPRSRKPRRR